MAGERSTDPVGLLVDADGRVWLDTGSRWVEVDRPDDLERILDRVAADRGAVRLVHDPGRADDGDEPSDRTRDTAAGTLATIVALLDERGLPAVVEPAPLEAPAVDED